MLPIRIPKNHIRSFEVLSALTSEELTSIVLKLQSWKTPTTDAKALQRQIAAAGIDADRAAKLAELIGSLESVYAWQAESTRAFVNDICKALQSDFPEEGWISESSLKRVIDALTAVLAVKPLFAAYKASYLSQQFERVYLKAKIFSDIRPVFEQTVTENDPPITAVVVHSINIAFQAPNEIEEIYLSAKEEDLLELRGIIDRAITKSRVMRQLITKAGIPTIATEDKP